jgi:DNA-binding response OmpR family regulator
MEKRILIIDDSCAERMLIEKFLGKFGYDVISAEDGTTGIKKALAVKPDLIVLDVVMPKMNGFETCRTIKSMPALAEIPVIMLTSKSETADEFWGRKQGADEYMTKPFDSDKLIKIIFRYISRHLLLRYEREERRQQRRCSRSAGLQ